MKLRILKSAVTNPWFNLATEDWIFNTLNPDSHTLFLWRNSETVVIGRSQNPWVECKTDKMEADDVFLARRQSGGGAVFHDLGNTNFTFLSPSDAYDQEANFTIIINALKKLGIDATLSGRNDMQVGDRKISGSAFRHAADRSFHHGTLLVNANMQKLGDYLNPHPLKLKAKGIKSVRARVANLVDFNETINHETLSDAIIEAFCKYHGETTQLEQLDEASLAKQPTLNAYYQQMADWDWRFGKTPEFSHHIETRFDWGMMDVHIDVKQAMITEVVIFSDALNIELIDLIKNTLTGVKYNNPEIKNKLDDLTKAQPELAAQVSDFEQWLRVNIS
ncbi:MULTISPECIES: lipoate--protein ligase [unclassified Psychrobacter]|uniref:lipoate--protein ligase n=1 Tax=unclassified Psychrobacter TaxID=196806 RepID=UPI000C342F6D|nr:MULTISPECIES: lipoate--protein ligase [unclassified Psychrobacter]MBA6243747.1 lipoate--protein ligase [Psychrobacter sp. Urea-trap-18]MBA6285935.1 lipoate--protein ligase [Psychrobacter sp. Urea-trap-16]MBA6319428.1 lipoate--protein ligase [Psychrobacter sp. Urea-trap-20]MBA6334201.1 lipoate--protein ligase [Psychrobacter sp. Urea-trap-19]PKG60799.1 lipoate--protein ligase [Psychrobacter sp. Choline-3u-12]